MFSTYAEVLSAELWTKKGGGAWCLLAKVQGILFLLPPALSNCFCVPVIHMCSVRTNHRFPDCVGNCMRVLCVFISFVCGPWFDSVQTSAIVDKSVGEQFQFVGKEGWGSGPLCCPWMCMLSTFERGDVDSAHWYLSGHEHVWPLLAFDGGMPCGSEESTRRVALFISLPLRLGWHCLACGADNLRNCWPPVIDIACVCIFFCFAASVLFVAFFFPQNTTAVHACTDIFLKFV